MKKVLLSIVGAIFTATFAMTSFGQIVTTQDESSQGACDGLAYVANYGNFTQMLWLQGDGATVINQNTDSVLNLCAGNYFFVYSDTSQMTDTVSFTIGTNSNNPCDNFTISAYSSGNFGAPNCEGSVQAVIQNGTAPYSYSWSHTIGGVSNDPTIIANDLCAGNYWFTAHDANGCVDTVSYTIIDSVANPCDNFMVTVGSQFTTSLNDCNGSAIANVFGGSGNYSFVWSNGATTQTIVDLCPGQYDVTVTDTEGCSANASANIYYVEDSIFGNFAVNVVSNDVVTDCDGYAYVEVYGGTPPYTYEYSNGATTAYTDSLCEGFYTVTVTDANGNVSTSSFVIGDASNVIPPNNYPDSTGIDTTFADVIIDCDIDYNNVANALITDFTVNGDSIQIIWSVIMNNGDTVEVTTDMNFIQNPQGLYSFVLSIFCPSKAGASSLKAMDNIYFGTASISNAEINAFNVYPNPTEGLVTISGTIANQQILVYDVRGKLILNTKANYGTHTLDLSSIEKGIYLISVEGTNTVQRVVKK